MTRYLGKITIFFFCMCLTQQAYTSDDVDSKSFFCCSVSDLYRVSSNTQVYSPDSVDNNKASQENDNAKIMVESDRTYRNKEKEIIILEGTTKISREDEVVTSELANVLQKEEKIRLSGNVKYTNEGLEVTAPYAEHNMKKAETDFLSPKYRYEELEVSGRAKYAIRKKDKTLYLNKASYTTCNLLNPDWSLFSDNAKLDFNKGIGTATDVFIKVKDFPVFYSPYMRFSLDDQRKTGFLVPDFSGSWSKGPDVATPFYWNISPNRDLLVTPSYQQARGPELETHFRYLERDYQGDLFISYLHDDDKYLDDRYNYSFLHKGKISKNLSIDLLYDKVSDKDYFADLGNGITSSSTSYIESYGKANYHMNGWVANLKFQGYQTTDKTISLSDEPYELLPELTVSKRWDNKLVNYDVKSTITFFDHPTKVDGNRYDIQIAADKTFNFTGAYIKPRIKLWHTSYDLENRTDNLTETPSKTIPMFSLESGFTLTKKISGSSLVHQFQPKMFYLYSAEENQSDIPIFDSGNPEFSFSQLFRDNNFTGLDRTSDSNQLSLALSSTLYDIDQKRNILTASIGQIIYFDNRNVTLDNSSKITRTNSEVAAEMILSPIEKVFLTSTVLFDPHQESSKTKKHVHSLRYRDGNNSLFNLSYRYRKNEIEQGNASFVWAYNNHLRFLGRWNYEFKNDTQGNDSGDLEVLAGFEYESCCWKFRLVSRRYKITDTEYDKNIQFQIMLKGFTDVGTTLGTILEDSISGYIEEDY
ncbi:MAG: LPS assembly protein LptD [Pseudomonadota bacterium]|nr:LPS assembly protein LptD [Pseudomonadota bacterium]